jgi:hypothetical protein
MTTELAKEQCLFGETEAGSTDMLVESDRQPAEAATATDEGSIEFRRRDGSRRPFEGQLAIENGGHALQQLTLPGIGQEVDRQ